MLHYYEYKFSCLNLYYPIKTPQMYREIIVIDDSHTQYTNYAHEMEESGLETSKCILGHGYSTSEMQATTQPVQTAAVITKEAYQMYMRQISEKHL